MSRLRRRISINAAAMLLTAVGTVAVGAVQQEAAASCQHPYVTWADWGATNVFKPFPHLPTYHDGPGGTMTVSVERTDSVSGTFGGAVGAEIDILIVKAKADIDGSIQRTWSSTTGHTYTHAIPPGRYGNMHYGNFAKHWHWKKILHTPTCTIRILKQGVATAPTSSQGWHYWSTRTKR